MGTPDGFGTKFCFSLLFKRFLILWMSLSPYTQQKHKSWMQIHFRSLHSRKTTAFWFDWVLPTGKPSPSSMMITVVLGEAGNLQTHPSGVLILDEGSDSSGAILVPQHTLGVGALKPNPSPWAFLTEDMTTFCTVQTCNDVSRNSGPWQFAGGEVICMCMCALFMGSFYVNVDISINYYMEIYYIKMQIIWR